MAAVDGLRVGTTPVLWEGLANGNPREFTFVLAGHALARYQFVPITDGIVHGTLARIPDDKLTPELPAPVAPAPTRAAPPALPAPVAPVADTAIPDAAVSAGLANDGGPP